MGVIYQYDQQYTSPTNVLDFYPVGSYYETSNSGFNPNNTWGGTWTSETISNDEIVEEGTNGIWTYRKWKSGISECWGIKTSTLTHYASALGGYAYYEAISIPSGMFNSVPTIVYSALVGGNDHGLTGTITNASSATNAQLYAISTTSGSKTVKWFINCKGAWKTYTAPTTIYRWRRTA